MGGGGMPSCSGHVFAAHVRTHPGLVWTALTDPGRTGAYLYGLAAHSTWVPGDPIEFRHDGGPGAIGRVLHVQRHERLSYLRLPVLATLQFLLNQP